MYRKGPSRPESAPSLRHRIQYCPSSSTVGRDLHDRTVGDAESLAEELRFVKQQLESAADAKAWHLLAIYICS